MAIYRKADLAWGTQTDRALTGVRHRPVIMCQGVIVWEGAWEKEGQRSEMDIAEDAWTHMLDKLTKVFK